MKTVVIIFLIILFAFPCPVYAQAANNTLEYAIIEANCVLFADDKLTDVVTSLPTSYFVVIIGEDDDYYHVTYSNLSGFIAKNTVNRVNYTPRYKFGSGKLSLINDGGVINVRSAPDHTKSNIAARLTDGTVMNYYGSVQGTVQNEIIGNKWYAVILPEGKIGYVYSMYAEATAIPQNKIEPEPEPETPTVTPVIGAGEKSQYFLIAAMCLPVIILMYLLFKPRQAQPNE